MRWAFGGVGVGVLEVHAGGAVGEEEELGGDHFALHEDDVGFEEHGEDAEEGEEAKGGEADADGAGEGFGVAFVEVEDGGGGENDRDDHEEGKVMARGVEPLEAHGAAGGPGGGVDVEENIG